MPEGKSNVEKFSSVLAELQTTDGDEYPVELVDKLMAFAEPLVALAQKGLEAPSEPPEGPEPQDPSVDEMSDEVKAAFQKQQEEFAALNRQLEEERKAREEAEELFSQERHVRRVAEFNEIVRTKYPNLPVEDIDQFAVDMLTIHDADQELYNRVSSVLAEADAKVKGALALAADAQGFQQFSDGTPPDNTGMHPYLAKVEEIRAAQFSDMSEEQGFVEAMKVAGKQYPQLARKYERETR